MTTRSAPLSRSVKLAFGVGGMAESIVLATLANFILLFYNQVLGAPAHLVGLAVSASLVLNAITDPLIGSWSDRTRSRWGRRHGFMFAAIVPTTLCFYAVFNPPHTLDQTGKLIWLCITNIVLLQALTFFHTPHLALGGELSSDYTERSSVMSYNTFFLWIGGSLSWWLSLGWFFRSSPRYPNGALDPASWPRFILVMSLLVLGGFAASAWFTRSRIALMAPVRPGVARFSPREFARDVGRAMANQSYVALLIAFFFLSLMNGVRAGLWMYGSIFFFRLSTGQISLFVVGSLIGYVAGSAVVTPLHRRFDKRWTAAAAALVYSVGPALPLTLGYFGVLGPGTPGLLGILIGLSLLEHGPLSILTTTVYSSLADIADENELRFGVRQEGVLYATRTLFSKLDQALGAAVAGGVLSLIAFPANARPGAVPTAVLSNLAGIFALSTLPGVIAAIFYARLRITRTTYAVTRAELARQAATCSPMEPAESSRI